MVWLIVLVLAIVCFVVGFTVAAKALFLVGLVLLAMAVGGGARGWGRRRSMTGGGRPLLGKRGWGRRRRSLL
jgi:hypothetical protein